MGKRAVGKGVLRGTPAAKKATKQQAFAQVGLLPELKKPADVIGKYVKLPGSFWAYAAALGNRLFECSTQTRAQ